ncbi:hypothetical protein J4457_07060 [Candidatus Woesearchaeota archaeon]|nr:hypothetical protein [Candidatus Woesearchaeota archaeon]
MKIKTLIATVLLCLATFVAPVTATPPVQSPCGPYFEVGDVDGNGSKNIADVGVIGTYAWYASQGYTITGSIACMDIDNDGRVTQTDRLIAHQAYVAGRYQLPHLGFAGLRMRYALDCNGNDPYGRSRLTALAIPQIIANVPLSENRFYGAIRNRAANGQCNALDIDGDHRLTILDALALERRYR